MPIYARIFKICAYICLCVISVIKNDFISFLKIFINTINEYFTL